MALSALRGVAALVVVQWHGQIFFGGEILPAGYLAVDFFFLLSGWVLAHAYDRRLAGGLSARSFMGLRLIRLYPVYLLALAVAVAMAALDHRLSVPLALASLLFLPDFWVPRFAWLIPPVWSLAAELVANLPFALFHRRLTGAVLAGVVILAFLGLVFTTLVFGSLDAGNWGGSWFAMFPRVFFSFFLGVLLYRHRDQFAKYAPRWAIWPSIAALLALMALPGLGHDNTRDLLVVCVGLPALLLFAASAAPGPRTAAIAAALGAMSYPLYLLHVPLFDVVNILILRPLTGGTLDNAPSWVAAAFLAGAIAISLAVDRCFDVPVRRWLTGRTRPTAPAALPQKQSA
jgi:peptidoglycan/LPS O-acetylase OafA/YrhL